jgi:hypothetical protein
MENSTQIIIFIVALVFSSGFIALVIVLVPAIKEMTALLADLRKTSTEVRDLTEQIKNISTNVEGKLEGIDGMLMNSRKVVTGVSKVLGAVNGNMINKAEWLALIPAIVLGYKAVIKLKRRKDEQQ